MAYHPQAESGVTRPCWSRITYSFTSRHSVTGSSLPSKIGTTGFTSCVHCNAKNISSKRIMHALTGSLSNSLTARNILFLQGQSKDFFARTYYPRVTNSLIFAGNIGVWAHVYISEHFYFSKKLVSQLTEFAQRLKIIPSLRQTVSRFSCNLSPEDK